MKRRAFHAALLALAATGPARADTAPAAALPPEVATELPGARVQGSGRMRYFGFHIYDARLFAAGNVVGADWAAAPLALELQYGRAFGGADIAERSLTEMRRQAEIAATTGERWLAAMKSLFPDVRAGDRITGLLHPDGRTRIFHNGQPRGEVRDPDFTRLFFGIWLSPRTSDPALRNALLGGPR
jgi:hypothetical protein